MRIQFYLKIVFILSYQPVKSDDFKAKAGESVKLFPSSALKETGSVSFVAIVGLGKDNNERLVRLDM